MRPSGVYIHFPFCHRLCFYCHFCKYPASDSFRETYTDHLIREILLHKPFKKSLDTVYFGGGSPSLIRENELEKIVSVLRDVFVWRDEVEFSIECNPEDISPQLLKLYKKLGINRISLGVQSFVDDELNYLQRTHSGFDSINAVEWSKTAGFSNVNVDLIIGLPGQTCGEIRKSLDVINRFNISHLSVYLLEGVNKDYTDQENEAELYFFTRDYLRKFDYHQYEVSNYAKSGSECRHNLKYWLGEKYVGLGASASGYEETLDYSNVNNLKAYAAAIKRREFPRKEQQEFISPELRQLIMGLRLLAGVERSCFKRFESQRDLLLGEGMLQERGHRLAVHPDKILLLNEILGYFMCHQLID